MRIADGGASAMETLLDEIDAVDFVSQLMLLHIQNPQLLDTALHWLWQCANSGISYWNIISDIFSERLLRAMDHFGVYACVLRANRDAGERIMHAVGGMHLSLSKN